jgi:hypothetical protein
MSMAMAPRLELRIRGSWESLIDSRVRLLRYRVDLKLQDELLMPTGSARYFYVSIDLKMKYASPGPCFELKYFTISMY